jgi:hypothetical protein
MSDLRRSPDLMVGWETHGYLADSYQALDVSGVEPTPQGLAHRAFEWFDEQLRRPVERATWMRWRGEASVLWLPDTGEVIDWQRLSRIPERPPRIVRLR